MYKIIFFLLINSSAFSIDPKILKEQEITLEPLTLIKSPMNFEDIQKKYGAGTLMEGTPEKGIYYYKIFIKKTSATLFVQFNNKKSVDFFLRPHSSLNHDYFYKAVVDQFGKKDSIKRYEQKAIYTWKNKDNSDIIYSATCTILCFPVYLSSVNRAEMKKGGYIPLLEKMKLPPAN